PAHVLGTQRQPRKPGARRRGQARVHRARSPGSLGVRARLLPRGVPRQDEPRGGRVPAKLRHQAARELRERQRAPGASRCGVQQARAAPRRWRRAMSEWIAAAPLLCVIAGGLAMMLVDAFSEEKSELATMTAVILAGSAAISGALWGREDVAAAAGPLLSPWLATDKLALFSDVVIAVGAALAALMAGGYLREHKIERGEF